MKIYGVAVQDREDDTGRTWLLHPGCLANVRGMLGEHASRLVEMGPGTTDATADCDATDCTRPISEEG